MDLLSRKEALLTICLLGAACLSADENQSDEAPQPSQRAEEVALDDDKPTEPSDKKAPVSEPAETKTPSAPSAKLKPLELKERVRAHANIDLPQDI